jgi:hypothetical protein
MHRLSSLATLPPTVHKVLFLINLFVCLCVHVKCGWVPVDTRRGIRSLAAGVTISFGLPGMGADNWPWFPCKSHNYLHLLTKWSCLSLHCSVRHLSQRAIIICDTFPLSQPSLWSTLSLSPSPRLNVTPTDVFVHLLLLWASMCPHVPLQAHQCPDGTTTQTRGNGKIKSGTLQLQHFFGKL